MIRHILIVGNRGAGKTTMAVKLREELNMPVFGFETKKENALADSINGSPIYIYDAGKERRRTEDNLVGYCKNHHFSAIKSAFDDYAEKLKMPVPEGSLIYMDELGFMETSSESFCNAVLGLLDGDIPVLATVKDKQVPFLDKVRNHPKVKCFYLNEQNRDEIYDQVLKLWKEQVNKAFR